MATAILTPTSVVSSTGWSGVTAANLADNDAAFEATDGHPGEIINTEITDAPADYSSGNTVQLRVRWNISGTATRAKSLLVQMVDTGGNQIGSATYTTPTKSSAGESTDTSTAISLNLSAAELTAARLRITVQEGGGMSDSVTALVDYVAVLLDYNSDLSVPAKARRLRPVDPTAVRRSYYR